MKDKGTLVVISGFSGAGKGTVSKALVEKFGYSLSVSATPVSQEKANRTEESTILNQKMTFCV